MGRIFTRIILLLFACGYLTVHAQDPHYSQYFNTPLFVNPANAGNGIEHMRATLIYRNQWASVANPFVTEGFMIDKKVHKVGFGFLVTKNSAGKAGLKQLNLSGVMSYNQPLGENHQLTGALQVGMNNKSFDPSQMTFDSQFAEDIGFDPAVSSGEVFTNTSITRPDLGAGFMWQRGFGMQKIKFKPFIGVAFLHLNRPSETFIVDENKLPVKSTYNLGAGIMVKENIEVRPSIIYMVQDHFHEFNFGAVTTFGMNNGNKFQVGLFNRSSDAMIAYAGYQVNQLFIGTSYDINTSGLKEVSHGTGGFELTLSYIPKAKKTKPVEPKKPVVKKAITKKEKIQKAEKAFKPVEQTTQLPEKIKIITKQPEIITSPDQEEKQQETITTAITEKQKPVTEKQESTVVLEKQEQPVALVKGEIKPVVKENITPVTAIKINAVKEKKANTPNKLKPPADRSTATPNLNTAFGEEKKEEINQPVVETPKPTIETKVIVENKIIDTDGDGINDDTDDCPYIRGGIKTNGCPDSDNDGIIDMKDKCPMEPGTLKMAGCPEVKITIDNAMLIKKFDNIEFETGKAVVKTNDVYDIIEYAIDIMYEYPDSRIILSGHTDSEGDELFNMHLSEQRSEVVKRYMVNSGGIDENRIQTVQYGETMPLMDNSTEKGKARNRRVEINIIKGNK